MGLFDKLFGNTKQPNPQATEFFKTLTAYTPVFTSWSGGVYESELVRSAIDARARHFSKLNVEFLGSAKPKMRTLVHHAPNEWQTWSQFMYRLSTILDVQNTAFIVPVYDQYGEKTGFYPVLPNQCEIVQFHEEPWLRYHFLSGQTAAVELKACGIMTKFQYSDDFFGENNAALFPTMDLVHIQNQGIGEAVKSAATYRFMARATNFSKAGDLTKERERFNQSNFENGDGGLLLFPNTYADIKQIDPKHFVVDPEQMKIIQQNVYNYFGVNEKILQNAATDEEEDSFFNGAIEPMSIQLSEVLTRMIYTGIEQSNGNRVFVSANRLQYMSVSHKISMAQQLGDRGMMTINEIRALFNYSPLDGGDAAPIRGEYYFVGEEKEPQETPKTAEKTDETTEEN